MGFEPTTTTLATWRSTPELLPPDGPEDREWPPGSLKIQKRCRPSETGKTRGSIKLCRPNSRGSRRIRPSTGIMAWSWRGAPHSDRERRPVGRSPRGESRNRPRQEAPRRYVCQRWSRSTPRLDGRNAQPRLDLARQECIRGTTVVACTGRTCCLDRKTQSTVKAPRRSRSG
jgi:hypothetical protein